MSSTTICHFNGCWNVVCPGSAKCVLHTRKGCCSSPGCHNQAYQGGVCVKHGARDTPCCIDGCDRKTRVSGLCNQHATSLPSVPCAHTGCKSLARGATTCRRHLPVRAKPQRSPKARLLPGTCPHNDQPSPRSPPVDQTHVISSFRSQDIVVASGFYDVLEDFIACSLSLDELLDFSASTDLYKVVSL
ncbi:unnamed protein product [Aphanomyces euteiches]